MSEGRESRRHDCLLSGSPWVVVRCSQLRGAGQHHLWRAATVDVANEKVTVGPGCHDCGPLLLIDHIIEALNLPRCQGVTSTY